MAAKQGLTAHISQASEDAKRAVLSRAPTSIKSHSWLSNLNTTCTIKSAPPRTPEVMTMLSVKSGWLVKRNEQHVWQRRWCCVVPHTFLYYFEAEPLMDENGDYDGSGGAEAGVGAKASAGVVENQESLNVAVREGYGDKWAKQRPSYYSPFGSSYYGTSGKDMEPAELDAHPEPASTPGGALGADHTRGPTADRGANLQPVGIIDLECYSSVNRSSRNDTVLEVTGDPVTNPDLRAFYFQAATADEADYWTKALINDRHSALRDEREAYRQVCDSFPIQLQQCSDMIDAAEEKASDAEKELYRVRSAAEEGRRKALEFVREVLERRCWGQAAEGADDNSDASSTVSSRWSSGRNGAGGRGGRSPSRQNHHHRRSKASKASSKLESSRRQHLDELDAVLRSPETAGAMNGGVLPAARILAEYASSVVASHTELSVELNSLDQRLSQSADIDKAALSELRRRLEMLEHDRAEEARRYEDRISQQETEAELTKAALAEVEQQLHTSRMEFGMLQSQAKQKMGEVAQHKKILKKEVIDLRNKIEEIGSERDAAEHRIENMGGQLDAERERNSVLERYIEKMENQVRVQQNMMEMMSQVGSTRGGSRQGSFVGKVVGPGEGEGEGADSGSYYGGSYYGGGDGGAPSGGVGGHHNPSPLPSPGSLRGSVSYGDDGGRKHRPPRFGSPSRHRANTPSQDRWGNDQHQQHQEQHQQQGQAAPHADMRLPALEEAGRIRPPPRDRERDARDRAGRDREAAAAAALQQQQQRQQLERNRSDREEDAAAAAAATAAAAAAAAAQQKQQLEQQQQLERERPPPVDTFRPFDSDGDKNNNSISDGFDSIHNRGIVTSPAAASSTANTSDDGFCDKVPHFRGDKYDNGDHHRHRHRDKYVVDNTSDVRSGRSDQSADMGLGGARSRDGSKSTTTARGGASGAGGWAGGSNDELPPPPSRVASGEEEYGSASAPGTGGGASPTASVPDGGGAAAAVPGPLVDGRIVGQPAILSVSHSATSPLQLQVKSDGINSAVTSPLSVSPSPPLRKHAAATIALDEIERDSSSGRDGNGDSPGEDNEDEHSSLLGSRGRKSSSDAMKRIEDEDVPRTRTRSSIDSVSGGGGSRDDVSGSSRGSRSGGSYTSVDEDSESDDSDDSGDDPAARAMKIIARSTRKKSRASRRDAERQDEQDRRRQPATFQPAAFEARTSALNTGMGGADALAVAHRSTSGGPTSDASADNGIDRRMSRYRKAMAARSHHHYSHRRKPAGSTAREDAATRGRDEQADEDEFRRGGQEATIAAADIAAAPGDHDIPTNVGHAEPPSSNEEKPYENGGVGVRAAVPPPGRGHCRQDLSEGVGTGVGVGVPPRAQDLRRIGSGFAGHSVDEDEYDGKSHISELTEDRTYRESYLVLQQIGAASAVAVATGAGRSGNGNGGALGQQGVALLPPSPSGRIVGGGVDGGRISEEGSAGHKAGGDGGGINANAARPPSSSASARRDAQYPPKFIMGASTPEVKNTSNRHAATAKAPAISQGGGRLLPPVASSSSSLPPPITPGSTLKSSSRGGGAAAPRDRDQSLLRGREGDDRSISSAVDSVGGTGSTSGRLSVAQRARMDADSVGAGSTGGGSIRIDPKSLPPEYRTPSRGPSPARPRRTPSGGGGFFGSLSKKLATAIDNSSLGAADDDGDGDDTRSRRSRAETTTPLKLRQQQQREKQLEFLKKQGLLQDEGSLKGGAGAAGATGSTPVGSVKKSFSFRGGSGDAGGNGDNQSMVSTTASNSSTRYD